MIIGDFNMFEVGTSIESSDVGNCNIFKHRSSVEMNCKIKDNCVIGTGVRIG